MAKQTVEYIDHMGTDLTPVNSARVSMNKESGWDWYDSDGRGPVDSPSPCGEYFNLPQLKKADAKLISYLAEHGHTSCFEHQTVTLRLKVPLFVRSQIHRHRTFAYNEISRRYVKDDLEFYWPVVWRKAAANVKQGSSDEAVEFQKQVGSTNDYVIGKLLPEHLGWTPEVSTKGYERLAVGLYNQMLEQGVAPEQARMILPQNLMTTFYMSGNLRNWAHFLKLRLDSHAQREVQEVAQMCADIIKPLFPISYEALMK